MVNRFAVVIPADAGCIGASPGSDDAETVSRMGVVALGCGGDEDSEGDEGWRDGEVGAEDLRQWFVTWISLEMGIWLVWVQID